MVYRPSEYPLEGAGKYYYISYESLDKVRSGKRIWKPHVKRVYISGKLLSWKHGRVEKKNGRVVNGIKFVYQNTRKRYTANRGGTRYSVSAAKTTVEKVVELPADARRIKISTRKSDVEPTLMDVR